MVSFTELFRQGAASGWLFLPTAVLLGALHGLEPGHSKTMMAAFIVAVRGTVPQAMLLGVSAACSHVVLVWVVAVAALSWGNEIVSEETEPRFKVVSGLIVVALAVWMLVRARRNIMAAKADARRAAHPDDDHHHSHGSDDEGDAHQRHHARQIAERFAGGRVTTGQVVLFGLTGGLLPCSAAVAVLLICLQLDHYALGLATVAAFSLGLAIALVAVGVVAAWGVGRASRRFHGVYELARRLPYLSSVLVLGIGVLMTVSGWSGLTL
jgi:nickel/cobalt exporter